MPVSAQRNLFLEQKHNSACRFYSVIKSQRLWDSDNRPTWDLRIVAAGYLVGSIVCFVCTVLDQKH
jgi:hypothetical protein